MEPCEMAFLTIGLKPSVSAARSLDSRTLPHSWYSCPGLDGSGKSRICYAVGRKCRESHCYSYPASATPSRNHLYGWDARDSTRSRRHNVNYSRGGELCQDASFSWWSYGFGSSTTDHDAPTDHESKGLSANASVYYVLLKGPYVMEYISVPPGVQIPIANLVEEVFDAHTGNLLVWGIAG
jgi:hypothetical protein